MCKLTNEQMLRYFIFKDCGFDEEIAKKSYDFVMGNDPEPQQKSKPATELADGIYLMYGKMPVAYKGQELSENEKNGCTGVGVKFGGKSLVVVLNDISDDDIELTTKQGGTRFITNYHQAAEDMDGKAATDDIRDILNMGIADDEHCTMIGTGAARNTARPTRGIWASTMATRTSVLRLRTSTELGPFQHFYP